MMRKHVCTKKSRDTLSLAALRRQRKDNRNETEQKEKTSDKQIIAFHDFSRCCPGRACYQLSLRTALEQEQISIAIKDQ